MTHEFPFLSLLLITGLAATAPLLASQLGQLPVPIVILEILVGMVIGKISHHPGGHRLLHRLACALQPAAPPSSCLRTSRSDLGWPGRIVSVVGGTAATGWRTGDHDRKRPGVLNNPPLDGRPLKRVQLPGDVLILGVRRGDDLLVPHGDTKLRQGDVLMLVGHPDQLHEAMVWLCPSCS